MQARAEGVICLLSSLQFHEIGTQLAHEVWLGVPEGTQTPAVGYPPLRIVRLRGDAHAEGIETFIEAGSTIRVYSLEKTIADCFKFRNKIGLDVALEALRDCWRKRLVTMDGLWKYAKVCRVANVMRPYLESVGVLGAYREMASDKTREADAANWAEGTISDATTGRRRVV